MKKINSIEIKNSTFFEDFKIHFDDKMNCLMGGRGTGKSTLLYFLKSALTFEGERGKIYEVLKNNLGIGELIVEIEGADSNLYKIIKTFNEDPQPYSLPSQEFVSLFRIYESVECDFYETNKIEEIGRSPLDRLSLIDKKIKDPLLNLIKEINKSQDDLDANAQDIKSINFRIKQINDSISQYENVLIELEELKRNEPVGILPDEKFQFELADVNEKKRTDEKRFLSKTSELLNGLTYQLISFSNDLKENFASATISQSNFLNKKVFNQAIEKLTANNDQIAQYISNIYSLLNSSIETINHSGLEMSKIHESQQAEFVALKQKFESNREYFNRYNLLTNRLKEKELLEQEKIEKSYKKSKLHSERILLLDTFNSIKNEIFTLRHLAIQQINDMLNGDVKITLKFSGITYEYEDRLREALKGSGLKYNELISKIIESLKPDQFAGIINSQDIESFKVLTGIDEYRSKVILEYLFESEGIYKIESTYCNDLPDFKLKIEGDTLRENYKNSDDLSMGQRCTTVLPIIFAVSDNPLIIDQPEDNLDNKYISEKIHNIIKEQKEHRQLIFITHNPNIPVLSDSEFNLFLNYENKKSKILNQGDIDTVKDDILKILEGGEKAFKVRKEKYDINYED